MMILVLNVTLNYKLVDPQSGDKIASLPQSTFGELLSLFLYPS